MRLRNKKQGIQVGKAIFSVQQGRKIVLIRKIALTTRKNRDILFFVLTWNRDAGSIKCQ